MSCCPDGSAKYLLNTYANVGTITSLSDGTEIYTSSASTSLLFKGSILMVSDVFGWNSGRTRNLADLYAQVGYHVIVPKIYQPCLDGASENDGINPDFFSQPGADLKPYIATIPYEEKIHSRIATCIEYLEASHENKSVYLIGFCSGCWVAAHIGASFTDKIKGIVCYHPRSNEDLMKKVFCPVLYMPAGNDPDIYRPGGSLLEIAQTNNPKSSCNLSFADMTHGWMSRGDAVDEKIKEAITLAITLTTDFLAEI